MNTWCNRAQHTTKQDMNCSWTTDFYKSLHCGTKPIWGKIIIEAGKEINTLSLTFCNRYTVKTE
jgi:hypothetical protein